MQAQDSSEPPATYHEARKARKQKSIDRLSADHEDSAGEVQAWGHSTLSLERTKKIFLDDLYTLLNHMRDEGLGSVIVLCSGSVEGQKEVDAIVLLLTEASFQIKVETNATGESPFRTLNESLQAKGQGKRRLTGENSICSAKRMERLWAEVKSLNLLKANRLQRFTDSRLESEASPSQLGGIMSEAAKEAWNMDLGL